LLRPENKPIVEELQKMIDAEWERLLKLEEAGVQL